MLFVGITSWNILQLDIIRTEVFLKLWMIVLKKKLFGNLMTLDFLLRCKMEIIDFTRNVSICWGWDVNCIKNKISRKCEKKFQKASDFQCRVARSNKNLKGQIFALCCSRKMVLLLPACLMIWGWKQVLSWPELIRSTGQEI